MGKGVYFSRVNWVLALPVTNQGLILAPAPIWCPESSMIPELKGRSSSPEWVQPGVTLQKWIKSMETYCKLPDGEMDVLILRTSS